jgi:hypothetical protein
MARIVARAAMDRRVVTVLKVVKADRAVVQKFNL